MLRLADVGLGLVQAGLDVGGLELDEQIARVDLLALLSDYLGHAPGSLVPMATSTPSIRPLTSRTPARWPPPTRHRNVGIPTTRPAAKLKTKVVCAKYTFFIA